MKIAVITTVREKDSLLFSEMEEMYGENENSLTKKAVYNGMV